MASKVSDNTKVKINKQVLSRLDDDGETILILSLEDDEFYFKLDGIAAQCWQSFDGKKTIANISGEVGKKTKFPCERIQKDLIKLTSELASLGLVQIK